MNIQSEIMERATAKVEQAVLSIVKGLTDGQAEAWVARNEDVLESLMRHHVDEEIDKLRNNRNAFSTN